VTAKRDFIVTLTYEVTLESDDDEVRHTAPHLMDAVYGCQVGNTEGVTDTEPQLRYKAEETDFSCRPKTEDD
jgi:hypothetical protein